MLKIFLESSEHHHLWRSFCEQLTLWILSFKENFFGSQLFQTSIFFIFTMTVKLAFITALCFISCALTSQMHTNLKIVHAAQLIQVMTIYLTICWKLVGRVDTNHLKLWYTGLAFNRVVDYCQVKDVTVYDASIKLVFVMDLSTVGYLHVGNEMGPILPSSSSSSYRQ